MSEVRFIGGPADGRQIDVGTPPPPTVHIPVRNETLWLTSLAVDTPYGPLPVADYQLGRDRLGNLAYAYRGMR